MAETQTSSTMTLKLLVDTNSKKVLFAEAGKDFIDFLFGLLQLPLSVILALLNENNIAGSWSLGKLYESIQNLNNDYLQPNQAKDSVLKPALASSNTKHAPLLNELAYQGNQGNTSNTVDGYVRGVVTYMVMDDLAVKPVSTISRITLLNTLWVKDIGSLEEKIVQVNMEKGLKLLKASFVSTTVLTDLFFQQIDNPFTKNGTPSVWGLCSLGEETKLFFHVSFFDDCGVKLLSFVVLVHVSMLWRKPLLLTVFHSDMDLLIILFPLLGCNK